MNNNQINIIENLFSKEDIDFFLNGTNSIMWETPKNIGDKKNYYNRKNLQNIFSKYKSYLENFLYIKYKKKYYLKAGGSWINKVIPSTNTNDDYHTDDSELSIVTYLNNDFTGGEFQYMNEMGVNDVITPIKGQSLIMDRKLIHRVLPIKTGERQSLVCFFDLEEKDFKTLL